MKIRITDMYKKDVHYNYKDSLVGSTGDVVIMQHHWRGWYYIEVENQSYVDAKVHDGYAEEGDYTCYGYAKFEVVEE